MEGSKGEEAFEASGLNPRLLINDILNMIDDIVESAFDFYHQEATKLVGSGSNGSSMRSENLAKGISSLRCLVERALDKQMGLWERYCLNHCFSVPEGFVLPKNQDSSGNDLRQSDLSEQLNMQLEDLRIKLAVAGKKNEELRREIHSLEKQSRYDAAVVETMQLLEQNSAPQTFKEIKEAASKLQEKLLEAMTKMKEGGAGGGLININMLKEGVWKQDEYLSTKLEEIQDVVQILKM